MNGLTMAFGMVLIPTLAFLGWLYTKPGKKWLEEL